MKERIFALCKALNLTPNAFSLRIGASRTFAKTCTGSISSTSIAKIIKMYPDVSLYWLVLGEGEMFINKDHFSHQDYKDLYEDTKKELQLTRKANKDLMSKLIEQSDTINNLTQSICELKVASGC